MAPAIRGSVTIDSATAAFTYTPSAAARQRAATTAATAAEKQDTIVVFADDGRSGVTSVAITVSVVPVRNATNGAPVAGTPVVGTPSISTGTVRGSVPFTDPDNDPLRYIAAWSPGKGTVSVDPATGTFTYTPVAYTFEKYRHRAAADTATAADKMDTFTIEASDLRGGTTDVLVTVPVSPANTQPEAFNVPAVNTANISGVVTGSASIFDQAETRLPTPRPLPARAA